MNGMETLLLAVISALLAVNTGIQVFYVKKTYQHETRLTTIEAQHKINHPGQLD